MFKCPKCNHNIIDNLCLVCNEKILVKDGIYYYTDEENINLENEGNKYIGYDEINIHFEPSLNYWNNHYGIYGAAATDIVQKRGKDIIVLDLRCGLGTATIPLQEREP